MNEKSILKIELVLTFVKKYTFSRNSKNKKVVFFFTYH